MNRIIKIAVHRPIAVLMLTLALTIFGWRALQNLETALLPDIEYPEFFIITRFPGGSPEEIERHITIPLEEVLSSLPGVHDIISHSREGLSVVESQFGWNIDFQFTLLRIREKIDAVRGQFPEGTERPYILDFNPNSTPVMELVVSSPEASLQSLTDFTEDVLQPRFSQLEGIAGAQISGAPRQSVQIRLKPEKLIQYNLSVSKISDAIRKNIPEETLSSRVMVGYAEYPLNVQVKMDDVSDLGDMPIARNDSSWIRLSYLADVVKKPLPQRSITYFNDKRVIGLHLFKESGANTVQAAKNALQLIETLKSEYPEFALRVIKNQGAFISQSIQGLLLALSIGAVLAFFVLLLFVRNLRMSLILSAVIPVSILVTGLALYLQNISLNIMSLGGLALGVGLIVDNGIIVTESISREMENGKKTDAVLTGTGKVAKAIVGATLTTIAIFFPIIYVSGYAAVLFKQQALTLTYTLLVSLFAALTLLPTAVHALIIKSGRKTLLRHSEMFTLPEGKIHRLYSRYFWRVIQSVRTVCRRAGRSTAETLATLTRPLGNGFDRFYRNSESVYHRLLIAALDQKPAAGIIGAGLLLLAFGAYFLVPQQYWPDISSKYAEMEVSVPMSVPFSKLREGTERTIRELMNLTTVNEVLTRISDPTLRQENAYQQIGQQAGFYSVRFLIMLRKPAVNPELLRETFSGRVRLPRAHLFLRLSGNLQEEFALGIKKNLTVYFSGRQGPVLTGENTKKVRSLAEQNVDFLRTLPSCRNVSLEFGGVETVQAVRPRGTPLNQFRLTPAQLAGILSQQAQGEVLGRWPSSPGPRGQQGNRKIPVILIWENPETKSLRHLLEYPYVNSKYPVPLKALVTVRPQEQQQEITRVNRSRVLAVQADVPPHRLTRVVKQVQEWRRQHTAPGVIITVAGESRRIAESFNELRRAFLLAVLIVYLILAAQFESLLHPLNILLTVPMGLMGALFGLILFQQSLNVISLIGIVMLIGIGVNDAIIKVDYMNYLRKMRKLPLRESIMVASREKFRPVIMTSVTTIVAMIPLLLGLGGNTEFNRPLAATIIGGLFFTTLLTLIYTPVIYEIFDKISPGSNPDKQASHPGTAL